MGAMCRVWTYVLGVALRASVRFSVCVWFGAAYVLVAPALSIRDVGTVVDPAGCPEGLSGITYAGGTQYYAVNDSGGRLSPINIAVDLTSGAITSVVFDAAITLGGTDIEGVAYNRARNSVWVSDETGATIKEYSLSGALLDDVAVPVVFKSYRPNFSLESLTVRGDGLEMWTCNEEALYNAERGVDDGPLSTALTGTVVRLQRFARDSVYGVWGAEGQWAYVTEPYGAGNPYIAEERSGVSDLCVLPDGTLLVLERRLGGVKMPTFTSGIFQVDFSGATDVSDMLSLNGATYTRVAKKELWSRNFSMAFNFEGIALGPKLENDAFSLILIADGDPPQVNALHALTLTVR